MAEQRQAGRARAEAAEPSPPPDDLSGLMAALQATLAKIATAIGGEAFIRTNGVTSTGARARALLRGRRIASMDLAESGGGYTLEEVRLLLNSVSRQSIERRVREGRLLAVTGPNNKRLYPVAQFHDDGSVVDGLGEIQEALATRNGYAVLNFLVNADPRLGNRSPIDLLKQGEIAQVVAAASRTGVQGA